MRGSSVKKSLLILGRYKIKIVLAFLCAIGSSVMNVIIPNIVGGLADIIKAGLGTGIDFDVLWKNTAICVAVVLTGFTFSFIREFITATVSQTMTRDLRIQLSDKLERLSIPDIDSHSVGDLISRATEDISSFSRAFATNVGDIIANSILIIGSFAVMIYYSPLLAILVIFSVVLGIVVNRILAAKATPRYKRQRTELGKLNVIIEENLSGFMVAKSFNSEEDVVADFRTRNEAVYDCSFKANVFSALMMPVMVFFGNLSYVVVVFGGSLMMTSGRFGITFGTITAFILYVRMFSGPLSKIAKSISQMQPAFAASARLFEIFEETEIDDKGKTELEEVKGEVRFEHVRFGYVPGRPVIHDFSAVVSPGMKVAIVGPTGAGKTTMVNLLMRFYDPDNGQILIDNVPLGDISRKSLHRALGMVLQDTWVFTSTIRDNLIFSTEGITDERLEEVLDETGLSHMLSTPPEGVDTKITEQDGLSAGQIQMITIARAMLKNPQILILDEATSSVDTRTELLIQKAIDSLVKGRTSFVIAHRLSTIVNADLILVMKDGDVVETGKHEDLLLRGGLYADIYNSQFDDSSEDTESANE
ncbi:MAG: ABC transporter ATP-binding protein/permease [Lachnospiraceae bacterium]|nr:ABC transporter ATP-binding protein/permease [Lachnospiraceae bacterium]